MADKPKMTCEFTRVVHISFCGEKHPEGFPYCPNDHGMLSKLYDFMKEHGIYPATRGGESGGGRYIHSFFEDDAEKIVKFFSDEGVECVQIVKEKP